jgi:hypothetical protein
MELIPHRLILAFLLSLSLLASVSSSSAGSLLITSATSLRKSGKRHERSITSSSRARTSHRQRPNSKSVLLLLPFPPLHESWSDKSFLVYQDMKLPPPLLKYLKNKKILKPTPIQMQGIPTAFVPSLSLIPWGGLEVSMEIDRERER